MGSSIKFTKSVSTNNTSNPSLPNESDRSFNDLAKSKKTKTSSDLFKAYDSVFYNIPKEGKRSHTSLILDSEALINNYVYPEDSQIKIMTNAIDQAEETLNTLEQPEIDANPFYPNGSFIRSNYLNTQGLPIWIMVNGLKREFKSFDVFNVARKALGFEQLLIGEDLTSDPSVQEASEDIIDDIPSGDNIVSEEDLVTIGEQKEGVIVDFDPNSVLDLQSFSAGCYEKQHYDNKGECYIEYYDVLGVRRNYTMAMGELLTSNPNNDQVAVTIGPRLEFQKDPNSSLEHGLIDVKGYVKLYKGNDTTVYNAPTDIELGGPPQYSNFGTRMFTKSPPEGDGYAVDSLMDPGVWSILQDKNNPYYDKGATYYYGAWHGGSDVNCGSGTQVYGAPILRWDNRYIVELKSFGSFSNIGATSSVMYLVVGGSDVGSVKRYKFNKHYNKTKR